MVKVDLTGVKIPKKVGGVKVPKKLRKTGQKLIEKANSPQGREAIAAGLAIAGSVIAAKARAKSERSAERGAEAGERAAERASERAAEAGKREAAAGERVRAKVVRHPSAPGEPGIDPARDPAQELSEAISAGVTAFQNFLAGMKR